MTTRRLRLPAAPASFGALRLAALSTALVILGCQGDTVAPRLGRPVSLSMVPRFQSRAATTVAFDRVRVTLSRLVPRTDTLIGVRAATGLAMAASSQGNTALDTTVNFPPAADTLALRLTVTITGGSEDFGLDLRLINAAGDTVFRGGPDTVTATSGGSGAPVSVAVRYVGVGANATAVRITNKAASVFERDSVTLTATALDGSGQPIPGTPIAWRSLDALVASVPVDTIGKVVAGTARGVARIEAMLPTNLADTARVTVQPVPAALSVVSGAGQAGPVGAALPQPLVALVKAADDLAVRNVYVHFAVTAGGGRTSADSTLTDSLGQARVTWTLGPTAGAQSVQASVAGVTSPASFAATATALAATKLAFTVQPSAATGGGAIAPSVAVAAKDSLGNTATTFVGSVTVGITAGTGKAGALLRGTATVAAVAGVATFGGINVDSVGTGYTLTASASGLTPATSAAFNVAAGAAASLTFTAQPPASTTPQTAFGFAITARDAGGNTATGFAGAVTAAIATNPAGGTLSGTLAQSAVAGVATFSGISIDNIGAGYTLSASATGLTAATSAAFSIAAPTGVNAWINTAGGNWSLATNWSKGTVPTVSDVVTIKQSGTYTVTLDVPAVAAQLDVGAPLGTQTLVLGGHGLAVAGNFTTSGLAALKMTSAADSVGVGGNATFAGGSTTGLLTAGVITVNGNFVQNGNAASFAPTTAHRVRLQNAGGATQTVSFASPATSFFDSLEVDRGFTPGTVQLLTDVRVNRGMTVVNSSTVTGPTSRVTIAGGTLHAPQSTTSPSVTALAIELSVAPAIGPSVVFVSPDTMVYNGSAITTLPVSSGLVYKSVRVNTTGALLSPGNVIFHGSLIVRSGTYTAASGLDSIGGVLRTENTGALAMVAGAAVPTVVVTDSAVFTGGSSTNLSAGLLRLRGNFVQGGATDAFAPSGTRVTFERAAGVQTIRFANPQTSFFADLVLNRPSVDTVRLASSVQVVDSAIVTGFTVLSSTTTEALHLPATGVVRLPGTSAVLRPSSVEFGTLQVDSAFTGGVTVTPDTAVFENGGTITSSSPAFGWKSVRLAGGALQSNSTIYNGNLVISGGTYTLFTGYDSVAGFLRTEGTGVLATGCGECTATLAVRDSAVFAGGHSSPTGFSTLRVLGDFVQRGDSTTFQPASNHLTVFAGATGQTVTLADQGARFGNLAITRFDAQGAPLSAGITLGSDVSVAGVLQDASTASAKDSILGNGHTVTAFGFVTGPQFVMNNAQLVTFGPADQFLQTAGLTFRNMSKTVTQWTMLIPPPQLGVIQLAGLSFETQPTTGMYFAALLTATGSATLNVAPPVNPTFGTLNGTAFYQTITSFGTVTVNWGSPTNTLTNQ